MVNTILNSSFCFIYAVFHDVLPDPVDQDPHPGEEDTQDHQDEGLKPLLAVQDYIVQGVQNETNSTLRKL